jgi:TonB family protein
MKSLKFNMRISTVALIVLFSASVVAQNKSLPRFENYRVKSISMRKPAPVNLRSHPKARLFRTQLRNGVEREGVNFAGHYSVVTWGCGSDCRMVTVVDSRFGNVFFAPFTISAGAEFHVSSRLFIANPLEVDEYISGAPTPDYYQPRWYVWAGRRFVQIFERQARMLRKKNLPPASPVAIVEDGSFPSSALKKTESELLKLATYRVEPIYPAIARSANAAGEVVVQVIINEEGIVVAARALRGHPLLQYAAVRAARSWRFAPVEENGAKTVVVGLLTFTFRPPA